MWVRLIDLLGPRLYRVILRWWVGWSRTYRFLFQRKYLKFSLDEALPLKDVEEAMGLLTWKPDSFKELFDACGSPHWVQYCLQELRQGRKQPVGALDCDDHAVWAGTVLESRYKPELFSCVWANSDGKIAGHVVCLCYHAGKVFHLGNWGKSRRYRSLQSMTRHMLDMVGAQKAIGWCTFSPDMTVKEWGLGLPPPGR